MNERGQASIDVLVERVSHLSARVEDMYTEMKTGLLEQGRRLEKVSTETILLGQKQVNSESAASNHYATAQIVHQRVSEHLDAHKQKEFQAEGKQEAFSIVDKLAIRAGPAGMAAWAIYSFAKEALK